MKSICKKEQCTACFACINACPKNCITMKQDDDLCHRPVINEDICISCNKCIGVCPSNNFQRFRKPERVLAAYSNNEEINKASTSGGVATEIARIFIENGGTVYGAAMGDDFTVNHIRCETADDLRLITGSKYVHSHINDTFSKAKTDLDNGRDVLFTGTGCQIAGLLNYLGKDYERLFTIDIVCHGAPDREIFSQYSKAILKDNADKAKSFSFRDGNDYVLQYYDSKGNSLYSKRTKGDFYLNSFLDGFSFRPNCHECSYATTERVSDITLGDFWGLGESGSFKKSENGNNLVLINTEKGLRLFDRVSDKVFYDERELAEAIDGNKQLSSPVLSNKSSDKFTAICRKTGNALTALKKCNLKKAILINLKCFIYSHKLLYRIIKSIRIFDNKI